MAEAEDEVADPPFGVLLGHGVREIGLAALAGSETGGLGLVGLGEEDDVCSAGEAGFADGPAEDLGGADAVDEGSVGGRVASREGGPPVILVCEIVVVRRKVRHDGAASSACEWRRRRIQKVLEVRSGSRE